MRRKWSYLVFGVLLCCVSLGQAHADKWAPPDGRTVQSVDYRGYGYRGYGPRYGYGYRPYGRGFYGGPFVRPYGFASPYVYPPYPYGYPYPYSYAPGLSFGFRF